MSKARLDIHRKDEDALRVGGQVVQQVYELGRLRGVLSLIGRLGSVFGALSAVPDSNRQIWARRKLRSVIKEAMAAEGVSKAEQGELLRSVGAYEMDPEEVQIIEA